MKKIKKWWEIQNKGNGTGEIKVFGDIAKYDWYEEDISAKKFTDQLEKLKNCKQINLRINSNGGSVYEAVAMYNSFKRFVQDNNIESTTYIEGIAASAASYLALASDKVYMGVGCKFMIHDPLIYSSGNSKSLREAADHLDGVKEDILDIYMKRTKLTREMISAHMSDEKYFSTKEAIEAGFVDEESDLSEKNLLENLVSNFSGEIINRIFPEIKNNTEKKGVTIMDLKTLRNQYPDLYNQIREEFRGELINSIDATNKGKNETDIRNAVNEERARIKNLESIETFNEAQKEIVNRAKYEEPKNAEQIIVEFYNSGAFKAKNVIENTKNEQKANGTGNIPEATPPEGTDPVDSIIDEVMNKK